jgi:hypothetical protein
MMAMTTAEGDRSAEAGLERRRLEGWPVIVFGRDVAERHAGLPPIGGCAFEVLQWQECA